MARYKDVDSGMKMLPVDLGRQLLPGTFEHALSHLIDSELDLSHFDAHYHNDPRGSCQRQIKSRPLCDGVAELKVDHRLGPIGLAAQRRA
jgi:hypothetical protein